VSYKNSGNPELSALHALDASKLKAKIKVALKISKGNLTKAAEALDVSTRSLHRWLARYPELAEEYKRQRIKRLENGG